MALPVYGSSYTISLALTDAANRPSFKASPTIAAGDFQISKDGGAFTNLTDLPTVTPAGGVRVEVVLTATEMTAQNVSLYYHDAAGGEWDDGFLDISVEPIARDANLVQIDGLATSGNNATLKLKKLSISNGDTGGVAFEIYGNGTNGKALHVTASGTGGNAVTIYGVAKGVGITGDYGAMSIHQSAAGYPSLAITGLSSPSPVVSIRQSAESLGYDDAGAQIKGTGAGYGIVGTIGELRGATAEPTSAPAHNASLMDKITWLFQLFKNKRTQTSTTETLYLDDGSTPVSSRPVSDASGTFTQGKHT